MNWFYLILIVFTLIYLVVGRVIAEFRWEWDGYRYGDDIEVFLTALFWPIYLTWKLIKWLALHIYWLI